jgi:hypothetical protein
MQNQTQKQELLLQLQRKSFSRMRHIVKAS